MKSFSSFFHQMSASAIGTVIGIIFLFSFAVAVVLIAPGYVDTTWTSPSSLYQVHMYEKCDPNCYISHSASLKRELHYVHHLKNRHSWLAFKEGGGIRIVAPQSLEKYVTRKGESPTKLTSKLLLLRPPVGDMEEKAQEFLKQNEAEGGRRYEVLELYDPGLEEVFALDTQGGILQNWAGKEAFFVPEEDSFLPNIQGGVIFIQNPLEFRFTLDGLTAKESWRFDPQGERVETLEQLQSAPLNFHSRQSLIELGEQIYAIEGCWYCHTDQTRTLIEDVVLNGTEGYPAPPSSANEFIYQKVTFPGTRRIGPDLSRVGIKRPSRDWHKVHFWSPKIASQGSIMPAFRHFFDQEMAKEGPRVPPPNIQFEAIYQYLMTKGTRITAPSEGWWLGKDPIHTKEIIEGQRRSR